VTVKFRAAEMPPPGAGVKTVTGTERAAAKSAAVSAIRSWVVLRTVVGRAAPFQRTTEVLPKPLPLTVTVKPEEPAIVLAGDRVLITGTGEPAAGCAGTGTGLHD
jgi:hypothetical protein